MEVFSASASESESERGLGGVKDGADASVSEGDEGAMNEVVLAGCAAEDEAPGPGGAGDENRTSRRGDGGNPVPPLFIRRWLVRICTLLEWVRRRPRASQSIEGWD